MQAGLGRGGRRLIPTPLCAYLRACTREVLAADNEFSALGKVGAIDLVQVVGDLRGFGEGVSDHCGETIASGIAGVAALLASEGECAFIGPCVLAHGCVLGF